jgi:hypothetical protein
MHARKQAASGEDAVSFQDLIGRCGQWRDLIAG